MIRGVAFYVIDDQRKQFEHLEAPPLPPGGGKSTTQARGVGRTRTGRVRDFAGEQRAQKAYSLEFQEHVRAVEVEMFARAREVNRAREETRTKKVTFGDFEKFKVKPKKKESEGPVNIDIYLHPERKKK